MIRKAAITEFLKRPRFDHRTLKGMSHRVLDEIAADLPVEPPIWKGLRRHQKVCFLIGVKQGYFAFLLDTGMGKTLLSIALALYFAKLGTIRQGLVLVPNRANKPEWAREIEKHAPDVQYRVLKGSSAEKWAMLDDGEAPLLTIETYAGLFRMCCDEVPGKKGGKAKLKPDLKKITKLAGYFQGLWMDESTSVKNHLALPYRLCRQIRKTAAVAFALTGTPFGRNPADLWPQLYLVDQGYTLGETLGLFRAAFFKSKAGYFGGMDHKFDRKRDDELHRMIANCSIRFEPEEGDLPKLVSIRKYIRLSEEPAAFAARARDAMISNKGNFREQKNAFLRMRQISSGFLGFKDDETGEKASVVFDENPKLDLLIATLLSIVESNKAIVFHEFLYSGSVIAAELDRLKIGYRLLNGKSRDPAAILHAFDHDDSCRVLALNNAAGGYGLNLQVARYGLYYESPVPAILRRQTIKRYERQGSRHSSVFAYDFICRGTFDERILDFHAEGDDLFKAIIQGRVKP